MHSCMNNNKPTQVVRMIHAHCWYEWRHWHGNTVPPASHLFEDRGNIGIIIECPLSYRLLPGIDPHLGLWHNRTGIDKYIFIKYKTFRNKWRSQFLLADWLVSRSIVWLICHLLSFILLQYTYISNNTTHWNHDQLWHVHHSVHVKKTLTDTDTQGQPKPLCEMLQQPVAISSMLQFPEDLVSL